MSASSHQPAVTIPIPTESKLPATSLTSTSPSSSLVHKEEIIQHMIVYIEQTLDELLNKTATTQGYVYGRYLPTEESKREAISFVNALEEHSAKFLDMHSREKFSLQIKRLQKKCQDLKENVGSEGKIEEKSTSKHTKTGNILLASDNPDESVLGRVIKNNDIESLTFFLEILPEAIQKPLGRKKERVYLTNIAAKYGRFNMLVLLEKQGANLSQQSDEGRTVLHDLARFNQLDAIKKFRATYPRHFSNFLRAKNKYGAWPIADATRFSITSKSETRPQLHAVTYLVEAMNDEMLKPSITSETKSEEKSGGSSDNDEIIFNNTHDAIKNIGVNWITPGLLISIKGANGKSHLHMIEKVYNEYRTTGVNAILLTPFDLPKNRTLFFFDPKDSAYNPDSQHYIADTMKTLNPTLPKDSHIYLIGLGKGGIHAFIAALHLEIPGSTSRKYRVVTDKKITGTTLNALLSKKKGASSCAIEPKHSITDDLSERKQTSKTLPTLEKARELIEAKIKNYDDASHDIVLNLATTTSDEKPTQPSSLKAIVPAALECRYHTLAYDVETLEIAKNVPLPIGNGNRTEYSFKSIIAFDGINAYIAVPVKPTKEFLTSLTPRTGTYSEQCTYPPLIVGFRGTGDAESAYRDTDTTGAGLDSLSKKYPIILQEVIENFGLYLEQLRSQNPGLKPEEIQLTIEMGGHSLGGADAQNFYVFLARFIRDIKNSSEKFEETDRYTMGCFAIKSHLQALRVVTFNAPGTSIEMCAEAARLSEDLFTKGIATEVFHKRVSLDKVQKDGYGHLLVPIWDDEAKAMKPQTAIVWTIKFPYNHTKVAQKLKEGAYGPHQDLWFDGEIKTENHPTIITSQRKEHCQLLIQEFKYGIWFSGMAKDTIRRAKAKLVNYTKHLGIVRETETTHHPLTPIKEEDPSKIEITPVTATTSITTAPTPAPESKSIPLAPTSTPLTSESTSTAAPTATPLAPAPAPESTSISATPPLATAILAPTTTPATISTPTTAPTTTSAPESKSGPTPVLTTAAPTPTIEEKENAKHFYSRSNIKISLGISSAALITAGGIYGATAGLSLAAYCMVGAGAFLLLILGGCAIYNKCKTGHFNFFSSAKSGELDWLNLFTATDTTSSLRIT